VGSEGVPSKKKGSSCRFFGLDGSRLEGKGQFPGKGAARSLFDLHLEIYLVSITSEEALAKEIARIANLSIALGYKLEDKNRILTREEAYRQLASISTVP
jgi:hypothetical protein